MTEKPLARMRASTIEGLGRDAGPLLLELLSAVNTPWYEDAQTVKAGLRWGRRKKRLLAWVRGQMLLRLSAVERRCIEAYYFDGLNYREAARRLGVNATSVYRAVKRGERKLREAARENPPAASNGRE